MFSLHNWQRNFYRLFIGQGLASLLAATVNYVLIFFLTETFKSASLLTLVQMASLLPIALFSPLAGILVDRFSKKSLLLCSDVIVSFLTLLLFLNGLTTGKNLTISAILLSNILRSSAMSIQNPAIQAAVPTLVPNNKLLKVNGQYSSMQAINQLLPPILGALLYGIMPVNDVLLLAISANLIGLFSVAITHFPKGGASKKRKLFVAFRKGLSELKQHPSLLHLLIFKIVSIGLIMPTTALYPIITTQYFHGSIKTDVPLVETTLAIGMILGGLSIGFWKSKSHSLLPTIVGSGIIAIVLTVSGVLPGNKLGFIIFVVLNFFAGASIPMIDAPIQTMIQEKISRNNLGKVISLYLMMVGIAGPIGLLIGSFWLNLVSVNGMFITSGLLLIGSLLVGFKDKVLFNSLL